MSFQVNFLKNLTLKNNMIFLNIYQMTSLNFWKILSSFVQLYILFLCKHNFIYCFKRVFFTFVHIFWQQFHKLITCFYTQLKLVIKLLCFFFNNSKVPDKSIKSLSSHKGSSSSQRMLPSGTSCPSLLDVLF